MAHTLAALPVTGLIAMSDIGYWFKFMPEKFMGGVEYLSMEARGAYITLLCKQFTSGNIPDKSIRLILGSDWVILWEEVRCKFIQDENGCWYNAFLAGIIETQTQVIETKRENGKKGGRPKTETKPDGYPNGLPDGYPKDKAKDNLTNSISLSDSKIEKESEKKFRDWSPELRIAADAYGKTHMPEKEYAGIVSVTYVHPTRRKLIDLFTEHGADKVIEAVRAYRRYVDTTKAHQTHTMGNFLNKEDAIDTANWNRLTEAFGKGKVSPNGFPTDSNVAVFDPTYFKTVKDKTDLLQPYIKALMESGHIPIKDNGRVVRWEKK